ncbi:hypothetical protein HRbin20_01589 [bacterium HR20]|nr:hypothetical protein HRbin20_01589 [bacterium HR20]
MAQPCTSAKGILDMRIERVSLRNSGADAALGVVRIRFGLLLFR